MKTNLAVVVEPEDDEKSLQQEVKSLSIIKVVDTDTDREAGERCKAIVAMEKRVGAYWDPLCDAAHKSWKGLVAKRSEFLDPLAESKKSQVLSMKTWEREEERKRQVAERIAQEAARKQAEDDALAVAEALEKQGTPEAKAEAAAIIEAPVAVPQVIIPTSKPAGFGSFTRENWKAEVTDIKALARAVLAGQVPDLAILGNLVFLGQQARALKGAMKYPGVRTWAE
jgi:hypothetical protein